MSTKFINRLCLVVKTCLPMGAALLFCACQFVPQDNQSAEQAGEQATELAEAKTTANPYLTGRSSPPAKAKERFELAAEAVAAGQWRQAEQHLLWLTQQYPEFSGPWLNLAGVYVELNQADSAVAAFEQAISANDKNVYAYNQYGVFLREQGNFAGAETVYRQVLAVWPDFPEAHLNLAILYDLYMGKLVSALEHYQAYQALQEQTDRQVAGWIIDLQRRLKARQANEVGEST